jgi:hypothetical protein
MPSPRHKKKGAVDRVSLREEPVRSRHGPWAGRGYRYQDAFTAHIALLVVVMSCVRLYPLQQGCELPTSSTFITSSP